MSLLISLPTHSMTMSDSSSTNLLDTIQGPNDLKKIEPERLPELAQEIRNTLITSLSNTGGHLGPNLGVVELTIAMHRVFDTPADKFLFDVSHQGYVHKMLTGRAKKISSIRQYEGLNVFYSVTNQSMTAMVRATLALHFLLPLEWPQPEI